MSIEEVRVEPSPAIVPEPRSSYVREAEPHGLAVHRLTDVVRGVAYSIRVPIPAGEASCPGCGTEFLAAGPTGFAGEKPICDRCLLDASQPLGMLVALAAVVRSFAAVNPASRPGYREARENLAVFARIYDRVAARSGPPRPIRLPDDLDLL